jgi:hypothetical protein
MSAELDIGLVAQGSEMNVVINGVSLLHLYIFDMEGPLTGMETTLEELLETVLVEKLLAVLAGNALGTFPIPEFDLSGLAPGIPAGTKLSLGELGVTKKKGFLQIQGKLQ